MGCARLSIQEDARKSGCCNCSFQGDSSLHFFPAVAFFARLQWPRVYNRLKLGKWGLGLEMIFGMQILSRKGET